MDLTQRLELFVFQTWFKELDSYFDDSQTWSFFLELWHFFWKKITQRIGPNFLTQRIEPFFFEYDAKNWTFFLWLNMTQRIEPFENDAENWTLFLFCRKELKLFPLCLWYDSKKWNLKKWLKELNLFFLIWLTELNLFFFHLYDSKNWTLRLKKRLKKSKSF